MHLHPAPLWRRKRPLPAYELVIGTPEPLLVAAHSDEGAVDMARDSVRADHVAAVLAARIILLPVGGGKPLVETTVAAVLGT